MTQRLFLSHIPHMGETPKTLKRKLKNRMANKHTRSYHWIAERAVSVALVPLTLAPFIGGSLNPALDAIFVSALVLHSHMGFQYARPKLAG